ncbi:MAG: recombinase family protein [Lachnospiraceae bacterium]|nr:recombinase family protein [Lachnospiraceae bacterium]
MDKAVLYLRISKEDVDKINKGDDSESIINQRLLLMDYAIEHEMQVVDVYSDDDYSGLYDDRPEFDRLIRDGKLGKFNVVISKTQSRFTRNMEHMEKYLHHDFPLLGIRFIGVVDGVDTQNVANKKSRQINGLINEWYCEDLSNNIRAVFQKKMKDGQFLGAFAPYGYLKDPKDKYKFIIDEYAADVVRRIYALFLEGYSLKAICYILQDDGILNPTLYKQQQGFKYQNVQSNEFGIKYNLWSVTTIKRILSNETYIGTLMQGTCKKVSYKDKKVVAVPREQWYIIKGHHEAIIDEETFYKVVDLRSNRRVCKENQFGVKKAHMFAGKLRCADCGHTMIKTGGGYGYLRCQLANKSRNQECTTHGIRLATIENVVQVKIQELVNNVLYEDKYLLELEQEVQRDNGKDYMKQYQKKIKEIDVRKEEISKHMKMLYQDRLQEVISYDMFCQLKDNFDTELHNLNEKRKSLLEELELREQEQKARKNLSEVVQRYTDYSTLTYAIVNDFIDYIEIGEKQKETGEQEIVIHWRF